MRVFDDTFYQLCRRSDARKYCSRSDFVLACLIYVTLTITGHLCSVRFMILVVLDCHDRYIITQSNLKSKRWGWQQNEVKLFRAGRQTLYTQTLPLSEADLFFCISDFWISCLSCLVFFKYPFHEEWYWFFYIKCKTCAPFWIFSLSH